MQIPLIGLMGYGACLAGFTAALVFALFVDILGRRVQSFISGVTAGALIAFVCFSLLPGAFLDDGLFVGIAGILTGATSAILIESEINRRFAMPKPGFKNSVGSTGLITALGVVLHHIPEGIALGLQLRANRAIGLSMCAFMALHCAPEATAFLLPLRKNGASATKLMRLCLVLALPLGISSLLGASISHLSQVFLSLCVSFAGGVIIYITCGRIIPDGLDNHNARITLVGAALGFAAGIALTAISHE